MVREMFEASDENNNGKLTLDEFKQFTLFVLEAMQGVSFSGGDNTIAQQFHGFDTNKDGVLDWDEIWAMMHHLETAMKEKEYSWIMTPTMTTDEFQAMVRQMFDVADHNKDEVLVLDEFKQFSLYILEAAQGLNLSQSD